MNISLFAFVPENLYEDTKKSTRECHKSHTTRRLLKGLEDCIRTRDQIQIVLRSTLWSLSHSKKVHYTQHVSTKIHTVRRNESKRLRGISLWNEKPERIETFAWEHRTLEAFPVIIRNGESRIIYCSSDMIVKMRRRYSRPERRRTTYFTSRFRNTF